MTGQGDASRGGQPRTVKRCMSVSSSTAPAQEPSVSPGETPTHRDAPSRANRGCKVRSWQEFTCYRER